MADPAWTVTIGDIVLDKNVNFDLDFHVVEQDNGDVDHIEGSIEVEADATDPATQDPAVVAQTVKDRLDMILNAGAPVEVKITLNGTDIWTFEPQLNVGSPRVVRFRTIDDDGAGDSHWRHHLTIYVKTPKGSQNLLNIQSAIMEESEVNKTTKKVWSISVTGLTLAGALGSVKSFKPSDPYMVQQIERFPKENRVVGRWVWEARETAGRIITDEDPPTILGGGTRYIVEKLARSRTSQAKPFPVLHEGTQDPIIIIIRGTRTGFTEASVAAPTEHFTEGDNTFRLTEEETDYKPRFNSTTGKWIRPFEERWMFLKHLSAIPEPNHSDHATRNLINPPADGSIGT